MTMRVPCPPDVQCLCRLRDTDQDRALEQAARAAVP